MSIQADILDTIGPGGVEVTALRGRLGNIGSKELDLAVNSLIRARSVRVVAGRYEVVAQAGRAPSAEEEAAASLLPVTRSGLAKQRGQPADVVFHSAQRESDSDHVTHLQDEPAKEVAPVILVSPDAKEAGNLGVTPINGSGGVDSDTHRPGAKPIQSERLMAPASQVMTSTSEGMKPAGDGAAQPSGCNSPPAASLHPVIADRVFAIAKVRRQAALNRIAQLEVELANQRSIVSRCDQFIELYTDFSYCIPGK